MGLFNKNKKKQSAERDAMYDRGLKEKLSNLALQTLTPGEHYDQLAYTSCEFGYLYEIEGHGLEALFKVITDKGTYYFAAQKSSLIRLAFNEELYKSTTDNFLSMHQ